MPDDLVRPAPDTCPPPDALGAAVAEIDAIFGEGYARDHPELVSAMIQAAAIDRAVQAGQQAHAEAMQLASRISRETNETLLKLKPRLFG